jgi:hypothetical protein
MVVLAILNITGVVQADLSPPFGVYGGERERDGRAIG